MHLYRIISGNEWVQSKKDGKVPRCNSDRRAGHVHLNKFDDILTVADLYFEPSENPVVLEINISPELNKQLTWEQSTVTKNWESAQLLIEHIDLNDVSRYSYLTQTDEKDGKFKMGDFHELS